jgi:hypothetical protein
MSSTSSKCRREPLCLEWRIEKVDVRADTDAARAKDVLEWPKYICFVVDDDRLQYGCDLDAAGFRILPQPNSPHRRCFNCSVGCLLLGFVCQSIGGNIPPKIVFKADKMSSRDRPKNQGGSILLQTDSALVAGLLTPPRSRLDAASPMFPPIEAERLRRNCTAAAVKNDSEKECLNPSRLGMKIKRSEAQPTRYVAPSPMLDQSKPQRSHARNHVEACSVPNRVRSMRIILC